MTSMTTDTFALPTGETRRPSLRWRFAVAFLVGLVAALAVGVGALYAYDQRHTGLVLPGVRIGDVDLSGLDPTTAGDRLRTAYGALGDGSITLTGPDGDHTITFAELGRRPDVESMIAEAMAVGRDGNLAERLVADARTALRGVILNPRVTYDASALAERVVAYADSLAREPHDASVSVGDSGEFIVQPGADGRLADPATPVAAALADLGELGAASALRYDLPVREVPPTVTTDEATKAKADAVRIAAPITLTIKDKDQSIAAKTLRSWLSFGPSADGGYGVIIDTSRLDDVLKKIAKKVDQAAINASYTTTGSRISGVTPSRIGYKMDLAATHQQVQALIDARVGGATIGTLEPTVRVTQPALTTAEATAARSKMRRISQWTTYFPITEKNGFGANIWIPARLIDGYVVAPGATFDFWKAVGPVTRAKGFRQGGAIINGRTEPQGALAGGICSCSTTLFNAALRAGYKMGARRNHYYYIDRYPVGLDATVFVSASGATQTMSFTNDTDYPLLIRGYGYRKGSAGYVKFEIYSVPNGRTVRFATGPKRNFRAATDTVQYTSSLPTGVRERVEYPVDGFQVSVTRTVRDRNGKVIHQNTYFSSYARITGITLVGR